MISESFVTITPYKKSLTEALGDKQLYKPALDQRHAINTVNREFENFRTLILTLDKRDVISSCTYSS